MRKTKSLRKTRKYSFKSLKKSRKSRSKRGYLKKSKRRSIDNGYYKDTIKEIKKELDYHTANDIKTLDKNFYINGVKYNIKITYDLFKQKARITISSTENGFEDVISEEFDYEYIDCDENCDDDEDDNRETYNYKFRRDTIHNLVENFLKTN